MLPTTYLFVPGDRPELFQKALKSGADRVVVDLEDSVSVDSKAVARAHVAEALTRGDFRACVRINGSDTRWFAEDCRLLSLPGLAAVMVPKAENLEPLQAIHASLASGVALIPIIETARGLAAAAEIAKCSGVHRLAFGSVDFQLDLSIEGDDFELLFARSQLVLASRLANIESPVDGVTLAVKDLEQTRKDALRARRLGFGAKLCIHPAQVAVVKEVFTPDAQSIAWARAVIDAASSTSSGAFTFEGKLIDRPVIDRARSLLQRTEL